MSERLQRSRASVLVLVAATIAAAAIVANLMHSGKILWGGVLILVLSLIVWQARDRNAKDARAAPADASPSMSVLVKRLVVFAGPAVALLTVVWLALPVTQDDVAVRLEGSVNDHDGRPIPDVTIYIQRRDADHHSPLYESPLGQTDSSGSLRARWHQRYNCRPIDLLGPERRHVELVFRKRGYEEVVRDYALRSARRQEAEYLLPFDVVMQRSAR